MRSMFGRQMAYLCDIDMGAELHGEPRIKDNISRNRDVLSSISWAFDGVLQGYAVSINPAKPPITSLGSIRDQAELSVVYALATRSASGGVPLLSTSHAKSCSSSG